MPPKKMENHVVLGVHITDRLQEAVEVQKSLTAFGGYIKTRLGLHEVSPQGSEVGSKNGLVLLEMVGPPAKAKQLAKRLNAITGVEVQSMVFKHTEP
jgi:hypothetical protein